jgi:hypothetical protein
VISLADLALEAAHERRQKQSKKEISTTQISDTLAAICEPAPQSLSIEPPQRFTRAGRQDATPRGTGNLLP